VLTRQLVRRQGPQGGRQLEAPRKWRLERVRARPTSRICETLKSTTRAGRTAAGPAMGPTVDGRNRRSPREEPCGSVGQGREGQTSKGTTTKEGASVVSANPAKRRQRIRRMQQSSEPRRASEERQGGHRGPRGLRGYWRGETFEGVEAQGRYRHETRPGGRMRKKASRECKTPRTQRSWGGRPSGRECEAQAERECTSLRLQGNVEGPANSRKASSMKSSVGDDREAEAMRWRHRVGAR